MELENLFFKLEFENIVKVVEYKKKVETYIVNMKK